MLKDFKIVAKTVRYVSKAWNWKIENSSLK